MEFTSPFPLITFDFQAGASFLSRLPLANPAAAEEQINQFLDSVMAAPPNRDDLLALLEQLRVPMAFVDEELGRRYHNKPLVLGGLEERCFQQVLATWGKLERAYALCMDGSDARPFAESEGVTRLGTVLHRRIHCIGMLILEHFRTRRELPPGLWLDLHRLYEAAEQAGVATTPVEDRVDDDNGATHCAAAYVAILLVDMGSPYSQSVRDINLMRRWAVSWSPLVSVHPLQDEGRMPSYLVELGKDVGLHPVGTELHPGSDQRILDTSRLARQMSHLLSQLRQKVLPSQLGLGEEPSGPVISLLDQLSRPWSQSSIARKFRRFSATGTARVCLGFDAMFSAVTGRPFEQPEVAKTYSRGEFNALFTFRQQVAPGQRPAIRGQDEYPLDEWEVINHSANGFRLARSSVGQKMIHGQLLAVCPHDGERFLLAQASWLMQEREGGLVAGVSVLPGLPAGVAVRLAGDGRENPNQLFIRAFLLSPVPNIAEKGSIVLPIGTYQASRVFDVHADGFWQIRLKNILQRGVDFERISFETV